MLDVPEARLNSVKKQTSIGIWVSINCTFFCISALCSTSIFVVSMYVLVNVNGFVFALLLFQAIFRWSTEVALTSCIVGKVCPPPHPLLLLAIGDSFLDALMDSATYITSKVGSFSRTINS